MTMTPLAGSPATSSTGAFGASGGVMDMSGRWSEDWDEVLAQGGPMPASIGASRPLRHNHHQSGAAWEADRSLTSAQSLDFGARLWLTPTVAFRQIGAASRCFVARAPNFPRLVYIPRHASHRSRPFFPRPARDDGCVPCAGRPAPVQHDAEPHRRRRSAIAMRRAGSPRGGGTSSRTIARRC